MNDKRLFIAVSDVEAVQKAKGRNSRLLISGSETGNKAFALGRSLMEPGVIADLHSHANEEEAMYFYAGEGVCVVGDQKYEIGPETVVLAPAGVKHQVTNTGTEPLKFVWTMSPPLAAHYSQETYHR